MYRKYDLDPLNFVTLASFSWKCALKITGIELELLTHPNMILDYETGITGRITRVFHHFRHLYMFDYDETKEISYIACRSFNNQHRCF